MPCLDGSQCRGFRLFAFTALLGASSQRNVTIPDDMKTVRFVHISDTHYREGACWQLTDAEQVWPCDKTNTTQLLRSIIEADDPHMLLFTGDMVDRGTTDVAAALDDVHGLYNATGDSVHWAAILGNHDQESGWSRHKILQHVVKMPYALTELGNLPTSEGNFYVNLNTLRGDTITRLVFFDTGNPDHEGIDDDQLEWFTSLTSSLPRVPTFAFYHIPLPQYSDAAANTSISGTMGETVCADGQQHRTFHALKEGGVIAGFCGHDHLNDYCVLWEGVQLCYEGSPGFTAYSREGWPRRARVTELKLSGGRLQSVRSWKRLDAGGAVAGAMLDDEILWSTTAGASLDDNFLSMWSMPAFIPNASASLSQVALRLLLLALLLMGFASAFVTCRASKDPSVRQTDYIGVK
eukprot:TRINITY_DN39465_c0_g1_i1.p1 TRINITY_DN39465_c0_g1~~TRINITY_DN39465_c0_g1_i1.p1  ORF type:complete len:424 (-),score=45.09 TRINITY_DN39465_c0_g1_i1:22-1242(-)